MLEPLFTPQHIAAAILREPLVRRGTVAKGALILNHVDNVVQLLPELRKFFLIIERKGWHGLNHSQVAEIKLVEDLSKLEVTGRLFPRAVLLPLSNADFVDTATFLPLGSPPRFDVIQIASWNRRKRIELLIDAAAQLPWLSFVQLGSFGNGGTVEELAYRDGCIRRAADAGARITFPFAHCDRNQDLPWDKATVNHWINEARMGVLTTTKEGHNRFKMECLAADRPVLVASDAGPTTQKHVHARSGRLFEPTADALAKTIVHTLEYRNHFAPREYLLGHSGLQASLVKLKAALGEACTRTGETYRFEDVYWDGRNERFTWGAAALEVLKGRVHRYREQLTN